MTFVITSACLDVKDQSCIEVCPVDCIYTDEEDRMCFVHPTECIDCGVCESACPVAAIFVDKEVPAEEAAYTQLNADYFDDKTQTREKIDRLDAANG